MDRKPHTALCCCYPSPCRQCTPCAISRALGEEDSVLEEREDRLVLNIYTSIGLRGASKCPIIYILPPMWFYLAIMGAATTTITVYKTGRVKAEFKTNLYTFLYEFNNVSMLSVYESLPDDNGFTHWQLSVVLSNNRVEQTEIPVMDRYPKNFSVINEYLRASRESKVLTAVPLAEPI